MTIKDWSKEFNEILLKEEEKIVNSPNYKDILKKRRKDWDEAVNFKHKQKLRDDPQYAEEWCKRPPEEKLK